MRLLLRLALVVPTVVRGPLVRGVVSGSQTTTSGRHFDHTQKQTCGHTGREEEHSQGAHRVRRDGGTRKVVQAETNGNCVSSSEGGRTRLASVNTQSQLVTFVCSLSPLSCCAPCECVLCVPCVSPCRSCSLCVLVVWCAVRCDMLPGLRCPLASGSELPGAIGAAACGPQRTGAAVGKVSRTKQYEQPRESAHTQQRVISVVASSIVLVLCPRRQSRAVRLRRSKLAAPRGLVGRGCCCCCCWAP